MLCLTRGRAFEALENRNRSRVWFAEALRMDARCYEALEHIVDTYMFTAAEGTHTCARGLTFSSLFPYSLSYFLYAFLLLLLLLLLLRLLSFSFSLTI